MLSFPVLSDKLKTSRMEWQCQSPANIEQQPSVRCALRCLLVGVINRYRPRTSGGTRGALISHGRGKTAFSSASGSATATAAAADAFSWP